MRVKRFWFVLLLMAISLTAVIMAARTDGIDARFSENVVPEETTTADVPESKPLESKSQESSSGSNGDSSPNSTANANSSDARQEASAPPDEITVEVKATAIAVTPAPTEAVEARPVQVKSTPTPKPQKVVPDVVDAKVKTIAKKDVKLEDYLEIIQIITGKLSLAEIKYIFDSARDDYWVKTSVDDIEKAREILFSKLSEEDLEKLDQLGREYGRSMTILEKDIDVAQVKEKQMERLGLIE